ncbi:LysR family transcriptional regulator [Limnobacter litoralis]|uniref:LysR family transcriptional regulator n=1 Tax=Limnobacter litoralis TaxID=481366 RepID=A0ABQ5YS81_9BURK|nr:LysR family transcriptional regulator [Limnobacter litoralis]GLR26984.1 LysR family transcriptional regulator [Limnobacter litoralis]
MSVPINLSRFDLISLRLFVATVESGSLTLGAERFGISVAAASRRISELETHLGTTLLSRGKKGVLATPSGLTFMRHAIDIIAGLEHLSIAMQDFQQGAVGHLKLWANTSAFTGFLPALLAEYTKAYPSVRLDLEDALSADIVRAVARGNAELGIIGDNTPAEGLETVRCDTDELVLITRPDHPLARHSEARIEDVAAYDLIGLDRATSLMRHIAAAADAVGRVLTLRVQVRGFDEVCRMIDVGIGIGVLPRKSVTPIVKSLGLRMTSLTGIRSKRHLLLAMKNRLALSDPAKALVEMAEKTNIT